MRVLLFSIFFLIKRKTNSAVLLAFMVLMIPPAWAEEEPRIYDRSKAKAYTVGVYDDDMMPLWGFNEEGEYDGFARSLLEEFAQNQNIRFIYKPYSAKKIVPALKQGDVQLIFPANKHWHRKQKSSSDRIIYSDGVHFYLEGIMVAREYTFKPLSSLDAIGIIAGKQPASIQDSADRGAVAVVEKPSYADLFEALASGEIQGIYTNVDVARARAKALGYKAGFIEFQESTSHLRERYRLATIKEEGVMREFNEFIFENEKYLKALQRDFDITGR